MKVYRLAFLVLFVVLSSILVVKSSDAQTCPGGKTAFVWVNGVLVESEEAWRTTVSGIRDDFFFTRPNVDPSCVVFDAVHNTSHGVLDWVQSAGQWTLQGVEAATYLAGYNFVPDINDSDYLKIVDAVNTWSGQGYRVVLVGHSQGTFFTNEVYDRLTTSPPDYRKLSVVNIASAAGPVADGRRKYTTTCGDPILLVPGSGPWTVNNTSVPCVLTIPTPLLVELHAIDTYLSEGLPSKIQVYQHLEDSLPDPGCGGDVDCYLKDDFSNSNSTVNYQIDPTQLAQQTSVTINTNSRTLQLNAKKVPAFVPDPWGVRTRRVFTGRFSASSELNFIGTGNAFGRVSLVKASDNSVALSSDMDATDFQTQTWTFTKSDTQLSLSVDGVLVGSSTSSVTDGYYLRFELRSDIDNEAPPSVLQIRNLSVTSTSAIVTPPPIARCLPGSFSPSSGSGLPGQKLQLSASFISEGGAVCGPVRFFTYSPSTVGVSGSGLITFIWTGQTTICAQPSPTIAQPQMCGTFTTLAPAPPAFTVSCLFAPNPAKVGWSNQVHLFQTGGVAPVTYSQGGVNMGTNNIFLFNPLSGTTSITFQVGARDATGRTASSSCSVQVVR